jgi:ABC-2 type transport system permease protein/sodium transport system permease protein
MMSEGNWAPRLAQRPPAVGVGRFLRLTRKELSETLRDHRTLLTLVLMPVLLYPLLAIGFLALFAARVASDTPSYRLAFPSEEEGKRLLEDLHRGEDVLTQAGVLQTEGKTMPLAAPRAQFDSYVFGDLDSAVLDHIVDVGMRRHAGGNPQVDYELVYAEESVLGQEAARYLRRAFEASNASHLRVRANALAATVAFPIRVSQAGAAWALIGHTHSQQATLAGPAVYVLATAETGTSLVRKDRSLPHFPQLVRTTPTPLLKPGERKTPPFLVLVPLVLILMTITGAVYPAIDLTAGERERGTLEVLMAAPVPRMSLLLAKYVAVLVVAMLTGLMNLGAMMLSIYLASRWQPGLEVKLLGEHGLSLQVLAEIFVLLLLFTSFFAALLLALASVARSFKEAQAYLVPLMVVALIPGMFSLVPEMRLDGIVPFVPLLNIVVLGRDVFDHKARLDGTIVVVAMTLIYMLAAISLAAALFGRDVMMAGSARPRGGRPAKAGPEGR